MRPQRLHRVSALIPRQSLASFEWQRIRTVVTASFIVGAAAGDREKGKAGHDAKRSNCVSSPSMME